jgi:hypothetical protein
MGADRPRLRRGGCWEPRGPACRDAGGHLGALSVSDDLEIGRRPLRRVLPQRTTTNVIAELGPNAPTRTLVVHAHHDAARTGIVLHPGIAKLTARVADPSSSGSAAHPPRCGAPARDRRWSRSGPR